MSNTTELVIESDGFGVTVSATLPPDPTNIERLVSISGILGSMAYWAVVQHPFNTPALLFDVIKELKTAGLSQFDRLDDTQHATKWFDSSRDIESWLRSVLNKQMASDGILTKWNTPLSKHNAAYVAVSAYSSVRPEDDFIDIDALLRNVATMVWAESAEYQRIKGEKETPKQEN